MASSKLVFIGLVIVALALIGEAAKVRVNLAAARTCSNGSNQTVTRALQECDPVHCDVCIDLCTTCSMSGRTCTGCNCDGGCDFCACDCS